MQNENAATDYSTYQSMVTQVSTSLTELGKVCSRMNLEESLRSVENSREKLATHKFSVGVMGEFKRGKSTVINSMLEKEIMPADILPCSATMNRVTYDLTPHVELKLQDGRVKSIGVDELSSYVTKLTQENESRAAEVEEAVVYYPCRFCQNGVDIVDTPGLNDDERMNRISEEVIPKLDAVIMVLTPDNPFSMSEAEFVRNKLMSSDLSRLIFLVNKIDIVRRAADRERVVEGIREKIQTSVMEKMESIYGKDSREYAEAKLKIGSIRVYPISALDALDGKLEGDTKLIEQSGTQKFEEVLTHMLTEERGALELGSPLSIIQRTSSELVQAVVSRKSALALNAEEFGHCQQEALEQIQELRQRKKSERKRLQNGAADVRRQLEGEVLQFYPQLEKELKEEVERVAGSLDLKALTTKEGQEAAGEQLQKAVSNKMEASMAILAEKLQMRMETIIGQEALRLGEFINDVSRRINDLQLNISGKSRGFDKTELLAYGIDTLFGGLGIGGIVSGYKNAGVKGAISGGVVSWVATYSMAVMLASMSVAALPLIVISCISGGLAGRTLTGVFFSKDIGKKELEAMKSSMMENIRNMIYEMRNGRELEKWVYDLVDGRFKELISGMEEECERLLKDTENTMDSIKKDITENEVRRKQMEKECDEALEMVKRLNQNLEPIVVKVRQVLESA